MTEYQPSSGYPTTPRYPAAPEDQTAVIETGVDPLSGSSSGIGTPPSSPVGSPPSRPVGSPPSPGDGSGGDASAKDKATDAAQAGKQAAGDVAQTAVGHGKEVAAEAQQQAKNLVSQARSQLQDHAHDQHRNAVTNLRSLGDELNSMANNGEQQGPAAQLVRQAADRTHAAADWLDGRQPQDVLAEVSDFARRRPGAFLLGALAAGVVAGRLTRGTIAVHQDDSNTGTSATGTGATGTSVTTTATTDAPTNGVTRSPMPGGLA